MPTQLEERLNANQRKDLRLISSMISKGESPTSIDRIWKKFIKDSANDFIASGNTQPKLDINDVVQYALAASYEDTNTDLQYYSEKVRYYNETKKKIRDHIAEIRKTTEDYLTSREKEIDSLNDMTQMDMLKLQEAMNKQSQLMQTMSNFLKTMHDTAKAIIRNLK